METAQIVLIAISVVVGVTCFYYTQKFFLDAQVIPSIQIEGVKENNDELAIQKSISLIEEAKEEIEMFDDGDSFESFKSLYNDTRFIEVVKKKLDDPNFKIRIFFNIGDSQLSFIQEFKDNNRVKIYKRKAEFKRPFDTHYKLIDGGIKGLLTRHGHGVGDRRYRDLVVLPGSKRNTRRAGKIVLKEHRQPQREFEELGAV